MAHYGELLQVVGAAVDVGPHIDQEGQSFYIRNQKRERGFFHALQGSDSCPGNVHHRRRVSHADESIRLSIPDQLSSYTDRGLLLFSERQEAFAHADGF